MQSNNLITARVLAEELDLSIETIWRYTREKRIPYIELGNKQYRYKLYDVIEALKVPDIVKEQSADYTAKKDLLYTYEDYLKIPDEPGYRYEILDGILIKEAAPNVIHQRVSRRLQRLLEDYFWEHDPKGEVLNSPLDVTLRETSVIQPDLLYVSSAQSEIIKDTHIDGAPSLAVEILSPKSRRKDRLQKLQLYQREGVEHYWIVSPDDKTLECFYLTGGLYSLIAGGMDDDLVEHPIFTGLHIPLRVLWEGREGV
ncbi:Uma2 family endonuclease [Bacillota bacterium]